MSDKFVYILIIIGVINMIAELGLIVASLLGYLHYYPVLQFIGTGLLVLFAIDTLKFNRSKMIYIVAGIAFIVAGTILKF
ncbi:hypothetical protein [Staphylococcus delphini]|uniref:Uncharacterized protein n=1 Tax=Staphylococcus delphini TaxID=53344 RepID=A0AAP8DS23_9STAP|nr:hypothetical protein [Staphylococcus delphini]MDE9799628.1 hypothetical protein [Staphylococcus delphini]MDE9807146.1 hypothetical protein [Staphylococcus delphini]MDE9830126.1 hypothetical protein [Staphylococcus delphini]PCF39708.1 hypothetical protein B5B99_04515 [Staphylococcus delphini]PCF44655.1 hypothetical protein B5B98_11540 [Staphylococcus delphini]